MEHNRFVGLPGNEETFAPITLIAHTGSLSAASKPRSLVFHPEGVPSSLQIVSPFKDVEGLHFKFHYNLYHKWVTFPTSQISFPHLAPQYTIHRARFPSDICCPKSHIYSIWGERPAASRDSEIHHPMHTPRHRKVSGTHRSVQQNFAVRRSCLWKDCDCYQQVSRSIDCGF